MSKAHTPFVAAHGIRISENIVILSTRSGGEAIEQAMSVKAFQQLVDRGHRAIDRYGRGEQDIIEGEA